MWRADVAVAGVGNIVIAAIIIIIIIGIALIMDATGAHACALLEQREDAVTNT